MIMTQRGQFKLKFKNGYEISIVNGYGSYCENHFKTDLFTPSIGYEIKSKECEIAILHKGKFVTKKFIHSDCNSFGYVSPDELADIIYKVKNYKGKNQ